MSRVAIPGSKAGSGQQPGVGETDMLYEPGLAAHIQGRDLFPGAGYLKVVFVCLSVS